MHITLGIENGAYNIEHIIQFVEYTQIEYNAYKTKHIIQCILSVCHLSGKNKSSQLKITETHGPVSRMGLQVAG